MRKTIMLVWISSCLGICSHAQRSITGFECVTTNVDYEYRFNGGWDSTSSVEVCVTGGLIAASKTSCTNGMGITSVKITWDENSKAGFIKVTSPKGVMTKSVFITPPLTGGSIDTAKKIQYIDYQKIPATIVCSEARGGNCNPVYSYQWQQSDDILKWQDIKNQTGATLKLQTGLTEPIYFRRKVIEKTSGSIAFSDEAAVFINPRIIK